MQTRSADVGHLQMLGAVDFAIRGRQQAQLVHWALY